MKPRFSPSFDRSCVKMADRFASERHWFTYFLRNQTRWSNVKQLLNSVVAKYRAWFVNLLQAVVCGNRRCQVCKYLEPGERFTSYRTGKSYTINYELDCNSSNVVYLLSCKVCHAQYVGSTTTKFRLRFNNHKARFRAHSRLSFEGRNKDDLLYRHFFGPGHHGLEDVSIQLIDRVSGEESALRDKEGQWAYRLNCIQPQGLNISDFFYSQNRSTRSRVR